MTRGSLSFQFNGKFVVAPGRSTPPSLEPKLLGQQNLELWGQEAKTGEHVYALCHFFTPHTASS